jgi:hypothetical protein
MLGAFDAGTISARLTLDIKDWSTAIEKAEKDTKSLGGVVMANKEHIDKLGKTMTAVGAVIVGSFGLMMKSAQEFTLAAGRLSDRTGIAVDTISGLREAADDAEVSMEELGAGLRRFASLAADASKGNKEAQAALDRLGISATDASGKLKPMDDLLYEAANAFSKMKDGTEKAALAQDAFGRGGLALIPLLNKGEAGIRAYTEATKDAGLAMDKEGVEKARAFRIAMDDLDDAFMAIKLQIHAALLPVVQTLANAFTGIVSTFRSAMAALGPLGSTITVLVGAFGALAATIGPILIMLPRLIDGYSKASALITTLNSKHPGFISGLGKVAGGLALVTLAAEATSFAFKKIHEAQDRAIAGVVKSAEEASKGWKFAAASIKGNTSVAAEDIKKFIARQRELGTSTEEIGQTIYEMYRLKIAAAIKTVANDSAELATKVADVQAELTDKIKSLTLNEFDYKIWQAQQYYNDTIEKAKGSVQAEKIAADAKKYLVLEIAKVRKEQAEAAAEIEVKSLDEFLKKLKFILPPVKGLFGKLSSTMELAFTDAGQSAKAVFAAMDKGSESATNNIKLDMDGMKTATKKSFSDVATSINQTIQVLQQGMSQFFQGLNQMSEQRYQAEIKRMDEEYEAKKKQIENSLLSEAEKTAALEALDAEYAEKKKAAEIKQAEANKKSSLMQAIVNTALAVTSALSMKPFFPLGLIAAAAALAAGYIQVRVIQNQAVPAMAEGGLVRQPTNILAGEAGPEAILPMRELRRMLGVDRKSGVGSKTVNVNISAIDTRGLEAYTRRAVIPEIKRAFARESLTVSPNAVR